MERRRVQRFQSQFLTAENPWKDSLSTKNHPGKDNQVLQLVILPLDDNTMLLFLKPITIVILSSMLGTR